MTTATDTTSADFRAALLAHAGLVALVGQRVAANAVLADTPLPYVVYTVSTESVAPTLAGLEVDDDARYTITAECWATSPAAAGAVADQVRAAVRVADTTPGSNLCAATVARSTSFDPETGLDATVLTIDWWP